MIIIEQHAGVIELTHPCTTDFCFPSSLPKQYQTRGRGPEYSTELRVQDRPRTSVPSLLLRRQGSMSLRGRKNLEHLLAAIDSSPDKSCDCES